MSIEIKVPTVGESINEVTVASWSKADGDYVELDEIICELESDKATFEVIAEVSGILSIKCEEGENIPIGAVLCEIDESALNKPNSTTPNESISAISKTGQVHEMVVPTVGESINEVVLASWIKNDGDFVQMDEVIAEVESDKATFELTAEAQGILKTIAKEGETLPIGGSICEIEFTNVPPVGANKTGANEESNVHSVVSDMEKNYATKHASPAARKLMSEREISGSDIDGTGKNGRITKNDVSNYRVPETKQSETPSKKANTPVANINNTSPTTEFRKSKREKMSNIRKTISKRLVAVKNETAMLTTFNEVNMESIMAIRRKYKESFKEKYEINLGFMSFFTRATCMALQEWPSVNAQIDAEEIIYNNYCDISIAVSTPKGLVVPVIRNAEKMSFHEIEKEVMHLATKAREGKLSIEDMQGGTFTITNGGIFGSMLSTPIINAPQSAILGMHNIVERPVVEHGNIVVKPIMYLALSYDHRIIDGKESVSFLLRIKQLLEDPSRLLLGI